MQGWQKLLFILRDLGHELPKGARVLDFGCGNGTVVRELNGDGFDSVGCDIKFKPGPYSDDLQNADLIHRIELSPYRLPYEDCRFDCVISQQVFEHVKNYHESLAEIHRVLKPGGVTIHVFPSRYRPIEGHVFVPLAGVFQQYWWLRVWAQLGIRNSFQSNMTAREVAMSNRDFLVNQTNYLTEAKISEILRCSYVDFRFCEGVAAKYTRLAKAPFLLRCPAIGGLLKKYTRVMFARRTSGTEIIEA